MSPHLLGHQPLRLPVGRQGRANRTGRVAAPTDDRAPRPAAHFGADAERNPSSSPWRWEDRELMRHYERAITASAAVLPFDQAASAAFATVRQDPSIHPADAIQTRLRVGGRRGHVHHQRSAVEAACGARHPLHPVVGRGQALTPAGGIERMYKVDRRGFDQPGACRPGRHIDQSGHAHGLF